MGSGYQACFMKRALLIYVPQMITRKISLWEARTYACQSYIPRNIMESLQLAATSRFFSLS